jgi:hypothetical protein
MPYSRSGEAVSNTLSVTSQTVMNSIRELGRIDNKIPGIKQKKKIVKTLFIEADEDHVALQNGKKCRTQISLCTRRQEIDKCGSARINKSAIF